MKPEHVILFKQSPETKEHPAGYVRFHALVMSSRAVEGHSKPILNLVHHKPNAQPSYQGIDWIETMERTLDVPHKSDRKNQPFYYLNEGEKA